MKRYIRLLLLSLFFIVPYTGWAQQPSGSGENPIARILDPLPEYNPFDEQARYRPKYFDIVVTHGL